MKTLLFIICLVLLLGVGIADADNNLLFKYAFDEGSGKIASDSSGNNINAKISGDVRYVKHDDGYALEFYGKTGNLDLGLPDKLLINGNMTIEAWVKSDDSTDDDQIIIGDTSGLGIQRNFLFYNSRGTLRFDHSDGAQSCTYGVESRIFNGEWRHVAFVAEYPYYYFYVDGKVVSQGKMGGKITSTSKAPRSIGGWWAGYFHGMIDDICIYNKAISGKEIAAHSKAASVPAALNISTSLLWDVKKLQVDANAFGNMDEKSKLRVSLISPELAEPVINTISLNETSSDSARYTASAKFDLKSFLPGDYLVKADLLDANGNILTSSERIWQSAGTPSWLNSKSGISDKVLAPYKPITVKKITDKNGKIKSLDVKVWGRTYTFGNSLFPVQIVSKGAKILAIPVEVSIKSGNSRLKAGNFKLTLLKATPSFVIVNSTGNIGSLIVSANHKIEYDGLIKSDWSIKSAKNVTLSNVSFNMTLPEARALYVSYADTFGIGGIQPKNGSAILPVGNSYMKFTPFVWFGDNGRGLEWMCESDENWHNIDKSKAIKLTRSNGKAGLILSLVDKPLELKSKTSLSYTFGLQASPVKAVEKDLWDYRFASSCIVSYGYDYDLLTAKVDSEPVLDYYQKHGVKTVLIMNWTNILAYTSPVGQEQNLRDLVRECHARGIKVVPYFGFQVSESAPTWQDFGSEMVITPEVILMDRYPGMEPQKMHIVCQNSYYQNWLTDTIAKLIDEYDIDGVYVDGIATPFACKNTTHGCGHLDDAGELQPTYPIFNIRDTFRRLYTIVKSRKSDGIVDIHTSGMTLLPALAWGTSQWTGEQLPTAVGSNFTEAIPLDRFRCEYTGVQFGLPVDFLHYRLGDYSKSLAITLPHDVLSRCHSVGKSELDTASSLWKLADRFDRKNAEFLPYWVNNKYIKYQNTNYLISLYKHKKNGVLAVISNVSAKKESVDVKFNLNKLGINSKKYSIKNALTNENIESQNANINIKLPALTWKILWIK